MRFSSFIPAMMLAVVACANAHVCGTTQDSYEQPVEPKLLSPDEREELQSRCERVLLSPDASPHEKSLAHSNLDRIAPFLTPNPEFFVEFFSTNTTWTIWTSHAVELLEVISPLFDAEGARQIAAVLSACVEDVEVDFDFRTRVAELIEQLDPEYAVEFFKTRVVDIDELDYQAPRIIRFEGILRRRDPEYTLQQLAAGIVHSYDSIRRLDQKSSEEAVQSLAAILVGDDSIATSDGISQWGRNRYAARALAALGPQALPAVPLLEKTIASSPSENVRDICRVALLNASGATHLEYEMLAADILTRADPTLQPTYISTLSMMQGERVGFSTVDLLESLIDPKDPRMRRSVIAGLGRTSQESDKAASLLLSLASDTNETHDVRWAASLELCKFAEAAKPLLPQLTDLYFSSGEEAHWMGSMFGPRSNRTLRWNMARVICKVRGRQLKGL